MQKHHNSTICIGNMTSQRIKPRGDNFCENNNKIYNCVEKTCGIYIFWNPGVGSERGDIYNTGARTTIEGTLPPNELQHLMNETKIRVHNKSKT